MEKDRRISEARVKRGKNSDLVSLSNKNLPNNNKTNVTTLNIGRVHKITIDVSNQMVHADTLLSQWQTIDNR